MQRLYRLAGVVSIVAAWTLAVSGAVTIWMQATPGMVGPDRYQAWLQHDGFPLAIRLGAALCIPAAAALALVSRLAPTPRWSPYLLVLGFPLFAWLWTLGEMLSELIEERGLTLSSQLELWSASALLAFPVLVALAFAAVIRRFKLFKAVRATA